MIGREPCRDAHHDRPARRRLRPRRAQRGRRPAAAHRRASSRSAPDGSVPRGARRAGRRRVGQHRRDPRRGGDGGRATSCRSRRTSSAGEDLAPVMAARDRVHGRPPRRLDAGDRPGAGPSRVAGGGRRRRRAPVYCGARLIRPRPDGGSAACPEVDGSDTGIVDERLELARRRRRRRPTRVRVDVAKTIPSSAPVRCRRPRPAVAGDDVAVDDERPPAVRGVVDAARRRRRRRAARRRPAGRRCRRRPGRDVRRPSPRAGRSWRRRRARRRCGGRRRRPTPARRRR